MKNTPIYLDHAATTPLDTQVAQSMLPFLEEHYANPSSLYQSARLARGAVESARRLIADLLGAKPTEIVFTSGGTEGDNLAVQGVLRSHPGAHWITTSIEHDAVLGNIAGLSSLGYEGTIVPVKTNGVVDPAVIKNAITDETVLISVMMANNEIGTIQPISAISKIVAEIREYRNSRGIKLPLYLHTDAVQAANYLDLSVSRLGVDLLTLNGSKIYGPKGIGALYIRHGTDLTPLFFGGGQERGRRSGTENVSSIVGLATALDIAARLRVSESARLTPLRDNLAREILKLVPGALLNGDSRRRLPNNLNITFSKAEGEAMVLYLDNVGIMASTGSACSTGSLDPSHVLLAIGLTPNEANSSLRLTLGRSTDQSSIDYVLKNLPPIIARLRQL